MTEPTKAYRVEERWEATSVSIVRANTVKEAKRKVRNPTPAENDDSEVLDALVSPAPLGIKARREPREDRAVTTEEGSG